MANQLSEWGESTEDDAVSDISDKLGVLLAELAEQEDQFAQNLEDSRGVLKQIRNTESSVQPSRTHKTKVGRLPCETNECADSIADPRRDPEAQVQGARVDKAGNTGTGTCPR